MMMVSSQWGRRREAAAVGGCQLGLPPGEERATRAALEEPNKDLRAWEGEVTQGRREQSNETSYQILMKLMVDDKGGEEDDRGNKLRLMW